MIRHEQVLCLIYIYEPGTVRNGIGAMFNGFLVRIMDVNKDVKRWLGMQEVFCHYNYV